MKKNKVKSSGNAKNKLAVIGVASALALTVAVGAIVVVPNLGEDDIEITSTPNIPEVSEEVEYGFTQDDVAIESVEPDNMGIEAEDLRGGAEKVDTEVPWYAITSDKMKADVVAKGSGKISEKGSLAYSSIINKIKAEKNPKVAPQSNTNSFGEDINNINATINKDVMNTINAQVSNPNASSNNSGVTGSDALSNLKAELADIKKEKDYYKQAYQDKVVNDAIAGTAPSSSSTDSDNIEVSNGITDSDKDTTLEEKDNATDNSTSNKGNDSDVLSDYSFSDKNPFQPLDSLTDTYLLNLGSSNNIRDYFTRFSQEYKNQLLVKDIKYEQSDSDKNVYKIKPTYLITKEELKRLKEEANKFLDKYGHLSDEKYAEQIANHIADMATYGESANKYSPIAILGGEKAVCQAYTSLAKFYLDAKGIKNGLVTGRANSIPHAWNLVVINGKEFHYDYTWFDTNNRDKKYLRANTVAIADGRVIESFIK